MPKQCDLTGRRFGRLVAVRSSGKRNGAYVWECVCDCGNTHHVLASKLNNGHTRSCGCLRKDVTSKLAYSHGLCRTRLYRIWCDMKSRCYNPHTDKYKFYGGKGVAICEEWQEFVPFYEWAMASGYKDNFTIDRKNSDGDYSPDNCRWITQSENATLANIKRWSKKEG